MKIIQTVEIELNPQEIDILQSASNLLNRICNEFPDCDNCPLRNTCSQDGYPHGTIQDVMQIARKPLNSGKSKLTS